VVIVAALSLFIVSYSQANDDSAQPTVRITVSSAQLQPRDDLYVTLAQEAMAAAGKDVHWSFEAQPMTLPQERMLREVQLGNSVDMTWSMTSSNREQRLLPVRIPLLRGLFGYRVLVIRKSDEAVFESIETLEDFNGLVGGQGQDWPDIHILRANGLEQISATVLDQLYMQLSAGRIDYVPRSITEVAVEQELYDFSQFTVLRSPVLRYPAPSYFFVSPKKPELASALEKGLKLMLESGRFQEVLANHPNAGPWFTKPQRWRGRRIIDLQNPLLHPATPLCTQSLWWQAGDSDWPGGESCRQAKPASNP
jgi:ABC-type amino acid transport substrate-binding protein